MKQASSDQKKKLVSQAKVSKTFLSASVSFENCMTFWSIMSTERGLKTHPRFHSQFVGAL